MKESFSSIRLLVVVLSQAAPGGPTSVQARAGMAAATVQSAAMSAKARRRGAIRPGPRRKVRQDSLSLKPRRLTPYVLAADADQSLVVGTSQHRPATSLLRRER